MVRRATLRASDSDREQAAERLRQAAAEGRLVAEELEERLATALRARTYGELDGMLADLPREQVSRRRSSSQPLRRIGPVPTVALVVLAPMVVALVVAVVAVVFAMVTAWAMLAAIVWLMLGHGRRWYGPRWAHGRRFVAPPRPGHPGHPGHPGLYGPRRAPHAARPGSWL